MGPKQSREHIGLKYNKNSHGRSSSEPNLSASFAPPAPRAPIRITVKDIGTSTSSLNRLDSGINSQERDTGVATLDHVNIDMLTQGQTVAVGMWAYETRTDGEDVSIAKGTRMIVLDDTSSELWTKVKLLPEEGWVPKNFIEKENSLESEEWFMDVNKKEGLEIVRHPQNPIGSFLIRRQEENQDFILVMKTNDLKARQFIIHCVPDSNIYYIASRNKFKRLGELVNYYRGEPVYMDTCLTEVSVGGAAPVAGLSRAEDDKYELDPRDIKKITQIGKGSFGEVFRGLWHNKVPVAIKEMNKDTMNTKDFIREAQAMKDMVHPSLVKLHGFVTNQEPVLIVTELVEKGDLLGVLRGEHEADDLNSAVFFVMAYQIVDGMTYLAGKNLIHRDLAARNILVTDNMAVKIADFGMARLIKEDIYKANQKTKFPVRWTAPEALEYLKCSEKSDVWSYGILLYEIYSRGAVPYAGVDKSDVLPVVKNGRRCPRPTECPINVYAIMKSCWQIDRDDRPTFSAIKNSLDEDDEGYTDYHGCT